MIKGERLSLRALEPSDVNLLYNWENDPKVWTISNTLTPFSKHIIEQYIMNSHQDIFTAKQLRLMIDVNEPEGNMKTIGAIDLFDFDPVHHRAGVGILISETNRRHGYATEALELLKKYAFSTLQLHQLYCNIDVDNISSLKLFNKNDFSIVGIKKEWTFRDGKWIDEYMLQCLNK